MTTTARYLIVGGGMTADAAVKGIREHDSEGAIVLVGEEQHPPYARPPLTKGLWQGSPEEKIWRGTEAAGADLRLSRRMVSLDLDRRQATDDQGEEYSWEKLLLATGGRPRALPKSGGGVVYYRTLDDYRRLRELAHEGAHVAVIGGGFIGSELAASLTSVGCRVTMIFPDPGIAWRLLPAGLSDYVTDYYRERGVDVLTEQTVSAATGTTVTTASGQRIEVDAVVAGLGIVPSTELAEAAGIAVDDGIVVDEFGRVEGAKDIFAAGDAASFPSVDLGRRLRVEHEDHAKTHGRTVGANMAGAEIRYDHLPFFYSDMFDLGYEAVGEVDARLRTVEEWEEPNRKGVVTYIGEGGRPRGFLFWNVWDRVQSGREQIRAGEPVG